MKIRRCDFKKSRKQLIRKKISAGIGPKYQNTHNHFRDEIRLITTLKHLTPSPIKRRL